MSSCLHFMDTTLMGWRCHQPRLLPPESMPRPNWRSRRLCTLRLKARKKWQREWRTEGKLVSSVRTSSKKAGQETACPVNMI